MVITNTAAVCVSATIMQYLQTDIVMQKEHRAATQHKPSHTSKPPGSTQTEPGLTAARKEQEGGPLQAATTQRPDVTCHSLKTGVDWHNSAGHMHFVLCIQLHVPGLPDIHSIDTRHTVQ